MSLKILHATDKKFTQKLIQANMTSYYHARGNVWSQQQFDETWDQYQNFEVFWNDTTIGVIRLSFEGKSCFIRELQIVKAYQGKGLGAKLLDWILRKASEKNYKELKLSVYVNNPARRLYLRKGFSVL